MSIVRRWSAGRASGADGLTSHAPPRQFIFGQLDTGFLCRDVLHKSFKLDRKWQLATNSVNGGGYVIEIKMTVGAQTVMAPLNRLRERSVVHGQKLPAAFMRLERWKNIPC